MRLFGHSPLTMASVVLLLCAAIVYAGSRSGAVGKPLALAAARPAAVVPLKDAKLNIEHNATDEDTGFQGFVDSEGWKRLDVRRPGGDRVLTFEARGALGKLGLTELFFESVEPENKDVPIDEMLAKLPEAITRSPGGRRRTARVSAARRAPPCSRTTSRPARCSSLPRRAPPCQCAALSPGGSRCQRRSRASP